MLSATSAEETSEVRVLVVEDDEGHRRTLSRYLADMGHAVRSAGNGAEALNRFAEVEPDIVLTDIRMPEMNGFELLRRLRKHAPGVDVILVTGQGAVQSAIDATKDGAFDFLLKPLDLDDIDAVVNRCIQERVRRSQIVELGGEELPCSSGASMVGQHPRMVDIYKEIGAVSVGRTPVLIQGETGTGKELVARCIHDNSPNGDASFFPVNCAAVPETLLESELFGHVKGAFTGATSDRKGIFELAGDGTVLLDEIGDTSPAFQAKLLRALQEKQIRRVGGEQVVKTHARVIASTNRNLSRLVDEGSFREDLLFRLRVVEIQLPPLRERRSDIPLLIGHILGRVGHDVGRPVEGLTRDALAALVAHDWPGNVRELENTLTRAVVVSRASTLTLDDLSLSVDSVEKLPDPDLDSLESVERRHVQRVLVETRGNKSEAARMLDISRPRLDRMIDRYGLTVL